MNKERLNTFLPFLNWWPLVNKDTFKSDLLAGLTGSIILVTQGVAFAYIAGLPPEYGLYAGMVVPVIAALFGSSLHIVSGPTTAISLVVFASLSQFEEPGSIDYVHMAFTLTLLVGIIQLMFGLVSLGRLVNFVSHSVILGFMAGAAVLIITNQMEHVMGVELERGSSFANSWINIFRIVPEINVYAFSVAVFTMIISILLKKFWKGSPHMFIAIVCGAVLSYFLGSESKGIETVSNIPSSLPPVSISKISFTDPGQLMISAFAIALLGLIEAVSIGRAIAVKTKQTINANQEFIGQGLSNVIGSFFSCYVSSASFSRSALNHQAGAKTPLAAIIAAILLMIIVLFFAPMAVYLPMPAIGGIILLVAIKLIDFGQIKAIIKTNKREGFIMLVTFLSTLFLNLEFAIYVGVIFSLLFYLDRTSHPSIITVVPNPELSNRVFLNINTLDQKECPQLKVIRIDGSLYFGAIDHISKIFDKLREDEQKNLLLIGSGINHLDHEGASLLLKEARLRKEKGGRLYISSLSNEALDLVLSAYISDLGKENVFRTKKEAIAEIYKRLEPSVCDECTARIFFECEVKEEKGH